MNTQDTLKQAVADAALTYILPHLRADTILGIGTGSTANLFIDALGAHAGTFRGAVASSEASAARLAKHGISVIDLTEVARMPFYIDGADEYDPQRALIKGGGGALTREKIVAHASDCFVCIVDQSKQVDCLGAFPLPIEVIPMATRIVSDALEQLGATPRLREGFVTDNGNFIIDAHGLRITNPKHTESQLDHIPGVVTNGLFALRPADVVITGRADNNRIWVDQTP